jgi:hypothetical protein
MSIDIAAIERDRVVHAADRFLREQPVTITACRAERSAGGVHDYFSEGDYWWPDPANPDGPYIRRDGMTNPENFVLHRNALIRLGVQMPALTAAWLLTGNYQYAQHAAEHLRAWFLDCATQMNPNLQYAQAIHGRCTGRGFGIIDTIHLVEVARAILFLRRTIVLSAVEHEQLERWFADYLGWMIRSRYGVVERRAKNNHGTCWVMQVAQFASYIGRHELARYCAERYKRFLVPNQIAPDGSLPFELRRTKPYCYCLFNLDALATICQILTTLGNDLWSFELSDGRGLRKAMAFMYPYIADKGTWSYPQDVQYFDQFPIRQPGLLFAGQAYAQPGYLTLWKQLNPDSTVDEVVRNNPIRQPVLWHFRTETLP